MIPTLEPLARKVLLIGWDAADWRVIDPLLEQGKMPHLAGMLAQGVRGNIATLYPALSPMLWTSIATGKRPYKHGIHGFTEPTPDGRGVRPVTNLARSTKAVWNILHQAGKSSNIVGWWPSHPAEPIRGVMVSNHFARAVAPRDRPWPLRPGTVHPERLAGPLAEFRLHPAELDHTQIGPFVPRFGEIDQEKDHRLEAMAKILAETASVQAAATALMQLEPWDFMAVYFDGIDHFSHGFMKYHPPRRAWIDERDCELYGGVIEAAYRFHDMMLGALLALAGEDTTVLLLSDHGFHPDARRPQHIPAEPAGPAVEHRQFGILAMRGPDLRRGEWIYGSSILDVCPTLLCLFGLPVGGDMDGKVLASAFEEPPEVACIPSWDDVPGDAGHHGPERELDPVGAAESIRQLIDLGYIEPLPEDSEKAVRQTVCELRFNLARAYMDGRRFADAAAILEVLWGDWPEEHRFGITLAYCLAAQRKLAKRRAVLDRLEANVATFARSAAEALERYKGDDGALKLDDLKPVERYEVRRLAALASPNRGLLHYLRGLQHILEGQSDEALAALERGAGREELPAWLQFQLGRGFLRVGRPEQAEACFRAALGHDPEDAAALMGLADAKEAQYDYESMLDAALSTVGLIFQNPRGHALVGTASLRLGLLDEAEQAFRMALHQDPTQRAALKGLTYLYRDLRPDPTKLFAHQQRIDRLREALRVRSARARARRASEARTPKARASMGAPAAPLPAVAPGQVVTVVSGLPRSGTSMMMQILVAGGIEPYADGRREADADNPRGYFEHEQATRLASNGRWLPEARGRVVKIVAPLLPRLPRTEHYAVVMMRRDLAEVVGSQRAMLRRLGRPGAALDDDRLAEALDRQMARVGRWAAGRPDVRVLQLDYGEVLAQPREVAERLAAFLGRPLDLVAMARAVEPSLRRQQVPASESSDPRARA